MSASYFHLLIIFSYVTFLGSLDKYEVGDLSGKFGSLADLNTYDLMKDDLNLPLFGANTIIGRSVVIHWKNGSRFVCSDIMHGNAKSILSATVDYTANPNSVLSGTVKMVCKAGYKSKLSLWRSEF